MFDEDLSVFFDDNDFAETVQLVRQARAISALIDAPVEADDLKGIEANLERVSISVASGAVLDVIAGDVLVLRGQAYRVMPLPRSQGDGITVIRAVMIAEGEPNGGSWR